MQNIDYIADYNSIAKANCLVSIYNYNPTSNRWNTSRTIPAKSAIWLKHSCGAN